MGRLAGSCPALEEGVASDGADDDYGAQRCGGGGEGGTGVGGAAVCERHGLRYGGSFHCAREGQGGRDAGAGAVAVAGRVGAVGAIRFPGGGACGRDGEVRSQGRRGEGGSARECSAGAEGGGQGRPRERRRAIHDWQRCCRRHADACGGRGVGGDSLDARDRREREAHYIEDRCRRGGGICGGAGEGGGRHQGPAHLLGRDGRAVVAAGGDVCGVGVGEGGGYLHLCALPREPCEAAESACAVGGGGEAGGRREAPRGCGARGEGGERGARRNGQGGGVLGR